MNAVVYTDTLNDFQARSQDFLRVGAISWLYGPTSARGEPKNVDIFFWRRECFTYVFYNLFWYIYLIFTTQSVN